MDVKSGREALNDFFNKNSSTAAEWHLAQKSEVLMFDRTKDDNDDKNQSETFVWRKKNQKIGLDKLDPEHLLLINKMKQEETRVQLFLFQ